MTRSPIPTQQMDLLLPDTRPEREQLESGAILLRQFAAEQEKELLCVLAQVEQQAPFRHMRTPRGGTMSAAMTCCGNWGWVSSPQGYTYTAQDLLSHHPWPPIPTVLSHLAQKAAQDAGYAGFTPNACLINRYQTGSLMGLHQDKDEQDIMQPIVSLSLGRTGLFMWGGKKRNDRVRVLALEHGDVLVWGGPTRLHYHGIKGLAPQPHPLTGLTRFNITFRYVAIPSSQP